MVVGGRGQEAGDRRQGGRKAGGRLEMTGGGSRIKIVLRPNSFGICISAFPYTSGTFVVGWFQWFKKV